MSMMQPKSDIREQLNKMFYDVEDMFFPRSFFEEWPSFFKKGKMYGEAWYPAVEMTESEKDFVVRAEIPGMKPEEINVEILGDTVLLSGECKEEHTEKGHHVHRSEFRYGRFSRRISLPGPIKAEHVKAEFQNGILELCIPKQKEEQRKKVKINVK